MPKADPESAELEQLIDDACWLLARGALRDLDRLGQLKNRVKVRMPDHPGVAQLQEAIVAERAKRDAMESGSVKSVQPA